MRVGPACQRYPLETAGEEFKGKGRRRFCRPTMVFMARTPGGLVPSQAVLISSDVVDINSSDVAVVLDSRKLRLCRSGNVNLDESVGRVDKSVVDIVRVRKITGNLIRIVEPNRRGGSR